MADTYPLQEVADAPAAAQQQPMQVQNPASPSASGRCEWIQQVLPLNAQPQQQAIPPALPNQTVQPPCAPGPAESPCSRCRNPSSHLPQGRALQEREPQEQEEAPWKTEREKPPSPGGNRERQRHTRVIVHRPPCVTHPFLRVGPTCTSIGLSLR